MPQVLNRIKPMHGPVVPAKNWMPKGVTVDGRQLFEETYKTNASIPDYPDMTDDEIVAEMEKPRRERKWRGERRWRKNPINAEPLVPIDRRRIITVKRLFFVESEGNFNQRKVFYRPPTAAELAAAEREGQKNQIMEALANALVDSPLGTEEIIARLTAHGPVVPRDVYETEFGEAQEVIAPEPEEEDADALTGPDADVEYPHDLGDGRWELSSGAVFKGELEEAQKFENQIQEARAAAEETPDF